jgi:hypothetical protein
LIPKHDIKQEGSLSTDVERIDTKFTTINNRREPEHYEKPKHRRGFNERADRQEEIKDEDLRRELKKGANLISYSET